MVGARKDQRKWADIPSRERPRCFAVILSEAREREPKDLPAGGSHVTLQECWDHRHLASGGGRSFGSVPLRSGPQRNKRRWPLVEQAFARVIFPKSAAARWQHLTPLLP